MCIWKHLLRQVCTWEACSGHPETGKRSSVLDPAHPHLNCITHTQNPQSTLSETSGALSWPGRHWGALLSLPYGAPPRPMSTHIPAAQTSALLCGSSILAGPVGVCRTTSFTSASSIPLSYSVPLRWRQHHLPPSHCAAQAGISTPAAPPSCSTAGMVREIHLFTPGVLGSAPPAVQGCPCG